MFYGFYEIYDLFVNYAITFYVVTVYFAVAFPMSHLYYFFTAINYPYSFTCRYSNFYGVRILSFSGSLYSFGFFYDFSF